jgi:hypothetical protein
VKLVKLDYRHNLKRKGYDWAFKFEGYDSRSSKVESAVKQLEGWRWDNTFWGKSKMSSKGYSTRPYYVGIKNESSASIVMLKVEI